MTTATAETKTQETAPALPTPETSSAKAETAPIGPDNGLGLGDFLKGLAVPAEPPATPSAAEVALKPAEDAPAEKAEAKAEAKAEKKTEEKAEEKAEEKKEETTDKQLRDTRKWANTTHQQNVELGRKLEAALRQIETLQKKMDGTYEEPKPEAVEIQAARTQQEARVQASHFAAQELFGPDEVQKLIWADDAPYRELEKDPAVAARVVNARLPVVEAVKVVREAESRKKYGADPEAFRKTVEQELTTKLTKQIRQQVLDELKQQAAHNARERVGGLADVRGVSKEETAASADQPLRVESLFPNFVQP